MNDKSISQDDAEAIAHSRFTEYTNDQKTNNASIDEAIEKTPQDLIGKDAYNLVSSIVDKNLIIILTYLVIKILIRNTG